MSLLAPSLSDVYHQSKLLQNNMLRNNLYEGLAIRLIFTQQKYDHASLRADFKQYPGDHTPDQNDYAGAIRDYGRSAR